MVCGVYQIINHGSGKSYIGQSRDIYKRWRQHTGGLKNPEALKRGNYPLRAAFLKYRLGQVVSKPGRVGVFEFLILEECHSNDLLERERYYIQIKKPEYNTDPGELRNKKEYGKRYWIQQHIYADLEYFPGELLINEYWNDLLNDLMDVDSDYLDDLVGITTRKKSALNTSGDTVFLITSVGNKNKNYYLWQEILVEEVQKTEFDDCVSFDLFGAGFLMKPVPLLNSPDFQSFIRQYGRTGFTSITKSPYLEQLKQIAAEHKVSEETSFKQYQAYIDEFYCQIRYENPNGIPAITLYSHEALLFMLDFHSNESSTDTITVFKWCDALKNYSGKILIHMISKDEETDRKVLEALQIPPNLYKPNVLVGVADVKEIVKYTAECFDAEQERHGLDMKLAQYRAKLGFDRECAWGIRLANLNYTEVQDVYAPEDIRSHEAWFPTDPFNLVGFRLALERVLT